MSTWAQTDFTGGEFSPYVDARIDAGRYNTGLSRCLNYYPIPQGPLLRRPGARFVHRTKDNGVARLIPFKFSQTQNYQIEFGNAYMRFYRNNGLVLNSGKTVSGVTRGVTTTLSVTAHGFTNGTRVYLTGLVDDNTGVSLEQLNNREFVVANQTTNAFEIQVPPSTAINSTGYGAWVSGGSVASIVEVGSVYTSAEIFALKYVQSLDTLYLCHPSHPPRTLVRTSDTAWVTDPIVFTNGPFFPVPATATTLTPSGTTGSVTITASAVTDINDGAGFLSTDVGRFLRLQDSLLNWVSGTITNVATTTSITVTLDGTLGNTLPITVWRLGLWSDTTGYPSVPFFFEDRLGFAGTLMAPQRLDMSRTGDYTNFQPTDADGTVGDDHALDFTLNSGDVNSTLWVQPLSGVLFDGTPAGEWTARSAYENEPMTPTSIFAEKSSTWGAFDALAIQVNKAVLYIHRGKRRLRELIGDRSSSRTTDLSELAYHLAAGGLQELAYTQEPHQLVWARKTDGGLLGMTYGRNEDPTAPFFAGWQDHRLGGIETVSTLTYGASTYTLSALVESISVIPSTTTNRDELWMVVQRKINGVTVRQIEYLDAPFEAETTYADANHLDSSRKATSGSDITELTGLFYFEGQVLNTWINGAAGPDVTVLNGRVTIDVALHARTVYVGYKYTSLGTLLRPEAGAKDGGPALGKIRRVDYASLNVYRTSGLEIAVEATAIWDEVPDATGADGLTGITRVTVPADDDYEGRFSWRQTGPEPGMLRSITGFLDLQDGG